MNANRSPQSLHADCIPISVVLPRNVCSFVNPRCSIWQQREAIGIDTTLHSGHDTRLIISANLESKKMTSFHQIVGASQTVVNWDNILQLSVGWSCSV